jgi:starch synthase (maltosyl-transferring)
VAIENVQPTVDCGRFAVKRLVGQTVLVQADVFADGHDVVRAVLLTRSPGASDWHETPMSDLGNDAWQADFLLAELGGYEFTIEGWVDSFATWHRDLKKRLEAGQEVTIDLAIGAQLVGEAAERASVGDAQSLRQWQQILSSGSAGLETYRGRAAELDELMARNADRRLATRCEPPRRIAADPRRAEFSAWYELFPRSCAREAGRHGTFDDCRAWLPRLAEMGFDVLYMPPIHPIGLTHRKGKNNATVAEPDDVGCPWAIGSSEGGHKSIAAELGTLADFRRFRDEARQHGIELALDIAFQCSPDHPYAKEHPEWFRQRPDGTIQYAENPPKKYQDIYPFDFEGVGAKALWQELTDVVLYWCSEDIRVFRVDNPHTKPFAFWEYLIGQVKDRYPETIFLSEAFTRPKVMYRLAKLGFSQSYTYFTWRNTKAELIEYFTELTGSRLRDYFRPNLWPNTPDILVEHLQTGGRAAFVARLVLAGTLSANYGIYGPAYETLQNLPREHGSEEYLDSEKYQLRSWDFSQPSELQEVISAVNRARRENSALQYDASLQFHEVDNEQLLCYSKRSADRGNLIVVVVNLNYHEEQHGFVTLPLAEWGIGPEQSYRVHDLLSDQAFEWNGPRNFVELDPQRAPAHIFRVSPSA